MQRCGVFSPCCGGMPKGGMEMELLFLADLSEAETAKRLICSLQYVRNQRCIALKRLRSRLMEGGDDE